MTDKKFSAAEPRRRYWTRALAQPDVCPECGGPLEQDYHCYLMLVQEKQDTPSFLVGSNDGAFCAQCPVVVLDSEGFAARAKENSRQNNPPFGILGIVDLAAVPEDKREMEFGEDNPVPLVEFLNADDPGGSHAPVVRESPKVGRNDPCPCGSGKKFKKCCGA